MNSLYLNLDYTFFKNKRAVFKKKVSELAPRDGSVFWQERIHSGVSDSNWRWRHIQLHHVPNGRSADGC